MRLIFSFLLCIAHLFAYASESLPCSPFEGDPAGIVAGSVDVLTGTFLDFEEDLIVQAPTPLVLRRSYSSQSEAFYFFPHCSLVVDGTVALAYERTGTLLAYSKKSDPDSGYVIDLEKLPGIANTARGILSARTNLKNNSLELTQNGCLLTCADGTLRQYAKSTASALGPLCASIPSTGTLYQLEKEILPSGNKILYQYNKDGFLCLIQAINGKESKVFSSLSIHYNGLENIRVQASNGQFAEYSFKKNLLEKVKHSTKPELVYSYTQIGKRAFLTKKEFPEGRFVAVEYTENGQVKALSTAASTVPLYTFGYAADSTEVINAAQQKTVYRYASNLLQAIETYKNGTLYKTEKRIWNKGQLVANILFDDQSRPIFAHRYYYDFCGNLLKKELHGNVTGGASDEIALDSQGIPLSKSDLATSSYTFSTDRFHLLLEQKDCKGSSITYEYKPGTNLLTKKFVSSNGNCKIRNFYSYNDDALLIREQIDDGCQSDSKNLHSVTEAHIREIKPIQYESHEPTEVVTEKYYDVGAKKEKIKRKICSTFNQKGHLVLRQIYDANGLLAKSEEFGFNAHGNCLYEVNPLGEKTSYTYDKNDNCLQCSEGGCVTEYSYDLANRLVSTCQEYAGGSVVTTRRDYDALGNVLASMDRYGNVTNFMYDELSRCTSITYPSVFNEVRKVIRPQETFAYDFFDNIISKTDPKGYTTRAVYNVKGKPLHVYHPDGKIERFKWDQEGSLHRKLNHNHTVTVFEYDYAGRPIHTEDSIIGSTGTVQKYLYHTKTDYSTFHCISLRNQNNHSTYFSYDAAGRLVSKEQPVEPGLIQNCRDSRRTDYVYDSLDRIEGVKKWVDDKTFITECVRYDAMDRIIEEWIEQPDGGRLSHTITSYDSFGNVCQKTSATSSEKIEYCDGTRPYRITDATGKMTQILYSENQYNELGQRYLEVTIIDPKGIQTVTRYDALERAVLILTKDPFGNILAQKEQLFDAVGNVAVTIESIKTENAPQEMRTEWVYGPMNRLEILKEAVGTSDERKTVYSYDGSGKLSSILYPGDLFPHKYFYDSQGRTESIKQDTEKRATKTIASYSYDNMHRITSGTSCDGVRADRIYNTFGDVCTENIYCSTYAYQESYKNIFEYDRLGRLKKCDLNKQCEIEYAFDGVLPKSVTRKKAGEEKKRYSHTFNAHNDQGLPILETLIGKGGIKKTDFTSQGALTSIQTNQFKEDVIERDHLDNPLKLERNGREIQFAYDAFNGLAGDAVQAATQYNSLNQLVSRDNVKYSYDKRGNLKEASSGTGKTIFTYNEGNQLSRYQSEQGDSVTYRYDIYGRRITRQDAKRPTENKMFCYIGLSEIGSFDQRGTLSELKVPQFVVDGRAIGAVAIELQGKTYLPITDLAYNIVQLIDPETEKLLESYQYSAFGKETIFDDKSNACLASPLNNPWRYRSERKDSVTQLIRMGLRDYDPKLQRFTTCDPLGYLDGPNLYAYAHNNPNRYSDPTGLAAESNEINTGYFYGNYESHCYCEKHRTCKRGGDIASALKGIAHGAIDFGISIGHDLQSMAFHIGASHMDFDSEEKDLIVESFVQSQNDRALFLEEKIQAMLAIDPSNIHYQAFRATTSFGLEVTSVVTGVYGAGKGLISLHKMSKASRQLSRTAVRHRHNPASSYQKHLLKTHLEQWQKYGTKEYRRLSNSRHRYYDELTQSKVKGEMAGRRMVREWNTQTGHKRTWHETLDHDGNIRSVRPETNDGNKVHYIFDKNGNFTGAR